MTQALRLASVIALILMRIVFSAGCETTRPHQTALRPEIVGNAAVAANAPKSLRT